MWKLTYSKNGKTLEQYYNFFFQLRDDRERLEDQGYVCEESEEEDKKMASRPLSNAMTQEEKLRVAALVSLLPVDNPDASAGLKETYGLASKMLGYVYELEAEVARLNRMLEARGVMR